MPNTPSLEASILSGAKIGAKLVISYGFVIWLFRLFVGLNHPEKYSVLHQGFVSTAVSSLFETILLGAMAGAMLGVLFGSAKFIIAMTFKKLTHHSSRKDLHLEK